jgi:hypothetical protein
MSIGSAECVPFTCVVLEAVIACRRLMEAYFPGAMREIPRHVAFWLEADEDRHFIKRDGSEVVMAGADRVVLPLQCPHCHKYGAWLHIRSVTVLTVKCFGCRHEWSMDIDSLPSDIREQVNAATEGVTK